MTTNHVTQGDDNYYITIPKELFTSWKQNCKLSVFFSMIIFFLGQLMQIELMEITCAKKNKHDANRENSLNGYKKRTFSTMLGVLTLKIPKLRHGSYKPFFLPALKEMEEQVDNFIVKSYTAGISERHLTILMDLLGLVPLSKSAISLRVVKALDKVTAAFDKKYPKDLICPIIFTDAMYLPIRIGGAVQKQAVIIVTGITESGKRVLLDLQIEPGETEEAYMRVFERVYKKGVRGVRLVVADGHLSIKSAVTEYYPGASLQLCVVHRIRKILSKFGAKKKAQAYLDLRRVYNAESYEKAKEGARAFIEKYEKSCPKAVAILKEGLEESLTYYSFPKELSKKLYSTNLHERFNRTVRSRLDSSVLFPNVNACRRLAIGWLTFFFKAWAEETYFKQEEMDLFIKACTSYEEDLKEKLALSEPVCEPKADNKEDFIFTYGGIYPFQIKHQNRLVNASLLLSLSVNSQAKGELRQAELLIGEEPEKRERFLKNLADSAKGEGQLLVLEAGHPFFSELIEKVRPQVCLKSLVKDILSQIPSKWKEGIRENLNELCQTKDFKLACRIVDSLSSLWENFLPKPAKMLRESLDLCFKYLKFEGLNRSKTRAPAYLNNIAGKIKQALKEGEDYIKSQDLAGRLKEIIHQINKEWEKKNFLSPAKLFDALEKLGLKPEWPLHAQFKNLGLTYSKNLRT